MCIVCQSLVYCLSTSVAAVYQVVGVSDTLFCAHAVCFCRSVEDVVKYRYFFDIRTFPVRIRCQRHRIATVILPVDGIVVNLNTERTIFTGSHTDHRCTVVLTIIYADIVASNVIYGCPRSRAEHQESTQVVMAVIVLVYTVLYTIVKVKCHAVVSNCRTNGMSGCVGSFVITECYVVAVP